MPKGVLVVRSTPAEGREDEYDEWYTSIHFPQILETPGFMAARRYRLVETGQPAGSDPEHQFLAVYDLDAADLVDALGQMRARSARGLIERRPSVLASDRPPVVTLYELIE